MHINQTNFLKDTNYKNSLKIVNPKNLVSGTETEFAVKNFYTNINPGLDSFKGE